MNEYQPRRRSQQTYTVAPQPYYPPQGKVVTKQRKRTSHGLHLTLTICTFGVWGVCVWFPLTLWHRLGPRRKTVTTYR